MHEGGGGLEDGIAAGRAFVVGEAALRALEFEQAAIPVGDRRGAGKGDFGGHGQGLQRANIQPTLRPWVGAQCK